MGNYLRQLEGRVGEGHRSRIFVMQSSGGITALKTAAEQPVRTVLSGPAGGVAGAAAVARRSGFGQILTFGMWRTSTAVALIAGRPAHPHEASVPPRPH